MMTSRLTLIAILLLAVAGCGPAHQPIKFAQGETAGAAMVRVANSLPGDQTEKFAIAVEALFFQRSLKNPDGATVDDLDKVLIGKTPAQIIAEYDRLSPAVKQEIEEARSRHEAETGTGATKSSGPANSP